MGGGISDTCHSEDAEVAVSPDLVLPQQEGEQHEQPPVVDHPPHVYVALHAVLVARKPVDPLGNQHGEVTAGGRSDALWGGQGFTERDRFTRIYKAFTENDGNGRRCNMIFTKFKLKARRKSTENRQQFVCVLQLNTTGGVCVQGGGGGVHG